MFDWDIFKKVGDVVNKTKDKILDTAKETAKKVGDVADEIKKKIEKTTEDSVAIASHIVDITKDKKQVSLEVTIENKWGSSINEVSLSHIYASQLLDRVTCPKLDDEETTKAFDARFRIHGTSMGHDYWLIRFKADEKIWTCKINFFCDLFAQDYDDGGSVVCRIDKLDGNPQMHIIPPKSSPDSTPLKGYQFPAEDARPVYAIGHKCNDKYDVGLAIYSGCNAIECDLSYNDKRETMYVNHDKAEGFSLEAWLDDTKAVMDLYQTEFALIIFDCKFVSDLGAERSQTILANTREIVRNKLTSGNSPINYIFSISEYDNRSAFSEIYQSLRDNEGIAIDESSDPEKVESFFKEIQCKNAWYGNGIFAAGFKKVSDSIKRGVELRDDNGFIKKVYVWTLAKESSIREYFIDHKVDGVLVNPQGLFKAVEEELQVIYQAKSLRFSCREDNPFVVRK